MPDARQVLVELAPIGDAEPRFEARDVVEAVVEDALVETLAAVDLGGGLRRVDSREEPVE